MFIKLKKIYNQVWISIFFYSVERIQSLDLQY
jgi:hypothetical protein